MAQVAARRWSSVTALDPLTGKFLSRSTNHFRARLLTLFSFHIVYTDFFMNGSIRWSYSTGIQRCNSNLHYVFRSNVAVGYRELCKEDGKPRWCDLLVGTLTYEFATQ